MAFEKYSTENLEKFQIVFAVIAIVALCLLCFQLGVIFYGATHGKDMLGFTATIPAIFIASFVLPLIFLVSIRKEIKKREHK